jgi:hypothetical protein
MGKLPDTSAEGPKDREDFILKFRWTVSRARDTYGYNVCTLYVDGKKAARCSGGGYDMEGTVLGLWIASRFRHQLCESIKTPMYGLTFHDPDFNPAKAQVPGTGETVEAREAAGESFGLERYQAIFRASSPVPTPAHRVPYLDGACGKQCMVQVLKAIDGEYQTLHSDKHQSIARVSAPVRVQSVKQAPARRETAERPATQEHDPKPEKGSPMNQYERNLKLLTELLPQGQNHISIENEPYMRLAVERIGDDQISLCHYGEQNGDLMQDPSVVFLIEGKEAKPVYFRNDYAYGYEEATVPDLFGHVRVKPNGQADLDSFVAMWWENIKDQGFFEAAKQTVAAEPPEQERPEVEAEKDELRHVPSSGIEPPKHKR